MDKFITNPKALIKNILITDNDIRITDEDYKTKEAFLKKIENGKKGILDTIHQIDYTTIIKIVPFVKETSFQIFFTENDKNKKTYLQFNSQEEFIEVLNFTVDKTHFRKSLVKIKSFDSYKTQLIATGMSILLFGLIFIDAQHVEKGEVVDITGRRSGVKKILLSVAETLGTTNTIILGATITVALAIWTITAYRKGNVTKEVFK
jgi:hypothetical protein